MTALFISLPCHTRQPHEISTPNLTHSKITKKRPKPHRQKSYQPAIKINHPIDSRMVIITQLAPPDTIHYPQKHRVIGSSFLCPSFSPLIFYPCCYLWGINQLIIFCVVSGCRRLASGRVLSQALIRRFRDMTKPIDSKNADFRFPRHFLEGKGKHRVSLGLC